MTCTAHGLRKDTAVGSSQLQATVHTIERLLEVVGELLRLRHELVLQIGICYPPLVLHLLQNEYIDVFAVLSRRTKSVSDDTKRRIQTLLRRWKQIDIGITEAANEAKDNVKYLFTLEKFIIPLYNGTPSSIIDTLPALMNSIKMTHSIARYYNTTERMANLFTKITNQMITNCKNCVTGGETYEVMWDKDPEELVRHLDSCLKLNEAYQQQYRVTKDKLFATPKGKQFEFNEMKFNLFCRRVMKLIDMFTTIPPVLVAG
ncbi:hypothetical protein PRIC2_005289 [Phytophthora ramorum]